MKFLKGILVILLLIVIIFAIVIVSRIFIVKDILNKVDDLGAKRNLYITITSYNSNDKLLCVNEDYIDKDSAKYLNIFTDFHFDSINDFKVGNTSYSYSDKDVHKEYTREGLDGDILTNSLYNLSEAKETDKETEEVTNIKDVDVNNEKAYNDFIVDEVKDLLNLKNVLKYSISSEKVRDVDCYRIKFYNPKETVVSEMYIEKDTGLLIREKVYNTDELFDYYYSFDTVTDEDFSFLQEIDN